MKRLNTPWIAIACTSVLSGCALFEKSDLPDRFSEQVEAKRMKARVSSVNSLQYAKSNSSVSAGELAAQVLVEKASGAISKDLPLVVASFSDSENVSATTGFGRMLSQQFLTQFVNNDYKVIELLLRNNIYISESGGEFLLSRKAKDLSRQYKAHAAVVGTYVVAHDTIFVNSKVVDISTNTILAAYSFNVALDENVKKMLEKSPYI